MLKESFVLSEVTLMAKTHMRTAFDVSADRAKRTTCGGFR
jgi:hypothetical protein